MKNRGQVLSVMLGNESQNKTIHKMGVKAAGGDAEAVRNLLEYADRKVRAGG